MITETTARQIGKSSIYILVPSLTSDWFGLKDGQTLKMEDLTEEDGTKSLKFTKK